MVARKALSSEDHVMRFVAYKAQYRDPETDEFLGISPMSMELGPEDEGGMSVTWVEHFGPYGANAKALAATAHRMSLTSRKLGAKSVFATGQVGRIVEVGNSYGKRLRIVYDPVPGNSGHSEVRHFTDDDLSLLDDLSRTAFVEIDHVKDMGIQLK